MDLKKIRIILVDDHQLVRESWKMLLQDHPRFHVIAECENGNEAIEQTQRLKPDVLLLDINMSPVNGFDVTQRIVETAPSVHIIGLSINNQPNYATRLMDLGASGYLTKTSPFEEITRCIIKVAEGGRYVCDEIKKVMPRGERDWHK